MEAINKTNSFILYGNTSPNVYKIKLFFEELSKIGVTYEYRSIDITKWEQYSDDFKKINPNKKIPAIIDNTLEKPHTVFESGSILIYLAQKYKKFLPDFQTNPIENSDVITWTIWQVANLGPIFGQFTHFYKFSPKVEEYPLQRFHKDTQRILRVLDNRLAVSKYIGSDEYSIADISSAGWLLYLSLIPLYDCTRESHKNIYRWLDLLGERESVKKILADIQESFKSFNFHGIRAIFTNDPELIKLNAPLGIENVKLQFP
ncbi:hypothetical protein DICPUDRAFT_157135 [Dictyostelium purpureum]|uniref:Glutathione S-transferase n=1 Tax=Dictyostelium purpureum TaxID=5786 RepID=F0ZYC4_DICPU|nr:uncharacterized protein DICPUDRAFT_157135 [Dictyostelium purpureum]EGC31061.1 hypothetical protein DICPUDRAFT_157135 [Dictyostelium purpureum]|eukprot:XP_003292420.1 hypothetical protein DICPUDRAFT_157135 [Dictyostelium purpureum]